MKAVVRLGAVLAGLVMSVQAWAGFAGHSVNLTWEDTPLVAQLPGQPPVAPIVTNFGTATVGQGLEFTQAAGFDFDLADGSVRLLVACQFCGIGFGNSVSSGFRISSADGSLPKISGVSIGNDFHVNIDPQRISYDDKGIFIDLVNFVFDTGYQFVGNNTCDTAPAGLCMVQGSFVQVYQPELLLNVTFAVPEPSSLPLFAISLVGLGLLRRKTSVAQR